MQTIINQHPVYIYTGTKPINSLQKNIVFIHGAQHDHSVWALQSRYFAHHGFNVIAPDLPGHGFSQGLALSSIEAIAEWLMQLLSALNISNAALVGHSMGSLVALQTAANHPDKITQLALLGAAFPMQVAPQLLDEARNTIDKAINRVNKWSYAYTSHNPSAPAPGFSMLGYNRRLMQATAKRHPHANSFYTDLNACNQYQNGLQAAAMVSCPSLMIIGKNDLMTPAKAAAALIDLLPNVETISLNECGHAMMAEQAEAVLNALKNWIND